MSRTLISYVLTAALRDRLFLALLLVIAVGASLSIFLGSSAITEQNEFALVFAGASLRLAGVAGLVLFIVFYIRRAFDSGEIDFLLTRPMSRATFLLSHSAAFSLLALLVALFSFAAVIAIAPGSFSPGTYLWGISFAGELIIMVNAALFFSLMITSPAGGAMAVFGLYILGRLMGELLGIVSSGTVDTNLAYLGYLMEIISLVMPRLDLMAQTSWLVYGPEGDFGAGLVALQVVLYAPLLVLAALVDLTRKQF